MLCALLAPSPQTGPRLFVSPQGGKPSGSSIWTKHEETSHTGIVCEFLTEGLGHGAKACVETGISGFCLALSPCTSGEDFAAFIGKVTVEGSALEVVPESMEPDGKTDNI